MELKISLKIKIVVTLVAVVMLTGFLAVYLISYVNKNQILEQKINDYELIVNGYAKETEQIFKYAYEITDLISENKDVIEYVESFDDSFQDSQILSFLSRYEALDRYSAIYIMDRKGRTLVSTDHGFVEKNYSFRKYFQDAIDNGFGIEMALGVTSGEPGYYFSKAISSPEDNPVGVVVVKLNPEIIESSIGEHYNDEIKTMLVDESGIVVFSREPEKLYKSLYFLTPEEKERARTEERFPNSGVGFLDYEALRQSVEQKQSLTKEVLDEKEERDKILSINPVGNSPFFVFLETGTEDIDETTNSIFIYLTLSILFAVFVVIFAILFFVPKFLKPLKDLSDVAQNVSNGNLEDRANVTTNDEIGQLAKSFNAMLDKLVKSRREIEKRIEERTAELERINEHMTGREMKMIELKKEIESLKNKEKIS